MATDRFERMREIFHGALEREPSERSAYLVEVCAGDPTLLAEVEALIAEYEEEPAYLDSPAWASFVQPASEDTNESDTIEELEVEPGLPFERLGEYRLIRRLGDGGMGVVYLAVQESLGRKVALKVIRPERMGSFEVAMRFWREVAAVSKLRHSNIVTVHGSGEEGGVRFFAMELVTGRGLNDVLAEAASRKERLQTSKILEWIKDIARALECAHRAGIIHRDVKPSNIRITPEGRAMLVDFGIARHRRLSTMTLTGEFRGTPHYASPEQIKARHNEIDSRTDVYSLGVTLYEAVTGRVPFEGETTEQVFHQILEKEPVSPRRLNPSISRDVETVTLKAMEKEPGRRYKLMASFAGDLERILNGKIILAKSAGFGTRICKRVKRHPLVSTAVGLAVLTILVSVGYVLLWSYPQTKKALEIARDRYEEIIRLADVKRLSDLLEASEELWPAYPENIDDLNAWLDDSRELVARRKDHQDALGTLRLDTLPYTEETERRDREGHPRWSELLKTRDAKEKLSEKVAGHEAKAAAPDAAGAAKSDETAESTEELDELKEQLSVLEEMTTVLEAMVSIRRTWEFQETEDQWRHDTLAGLVSGIEGLMDENHGAVQSVHKRLDFATTIEKRSITDHREAWQKAIASIANEDECSQYKGLVIKEQIGLVPIGRDLETGLWEFTQLQTGDKPKRDHDGKLRLTEETGLVFVLIPGGAFKMGAMNSSQKKPIGSSNVDPQAESDERPVHDVTINPFLLSKYEMTQGQWLRATGDNPSIQRAPESFGDRQVTLLHPVEYVSWEDCEQLLWRLKLRLPSEAEWEYAMRAGTTTVWWTGDEEGSLVAHDSDVRTFAANLADLFCKKFAFRKDWPYVDWDDSYAVHSPVGRFLPNSFGLCDIGGNVSEWCQDLYHKNYYGAPSDGAAWNTGASRFRIIRGGSWDYGSARCRSACRGRGSPGNRVSDVGVRPACSLGD